MNAVNDPHDPLAGASREEIMSALFANLVVQQTNMAFMFLGRMPHPETGQVIQDIESAKFFIDQLEMIEVKTRGNLDARETQLLKQSLTTLQMAFVEVVNQAGKGQRPAAPSQSQAPAPEPAPPPPSQPAGSPSPSAGAPAPEPVSEEEEPKKRFSKKY
jgi:hypothetical protein